MRGELTSSSCASVRAGCDELLRFPEDVSRAGAGCDIVVDGVLHIVCSVRICIAQHGDYIPLHAALSGASSLGSLTGWRWL